MFYINRTPKHYTCCPVGVVLWFNRTNMGKRTNYTRINLSGNVYGRLTVIRETKPVNFISGKPNRRWLCKCECGVIKGYDQMHLTRKNKGSKSCGCLAKQKLFKTKNTLHYRRLYNVWHKMKYRCEVATSSDWHKYGKRGIVVSKEWHDFSVFYNDMIDTYQSGLTIERIDVNGNYCKENCIWIKNEDQAKNRRTTVWVDGVCAKDFCKKNNISYCSFLTKKNKHGLSINEIKQSFGIS